MAKRKRKSTKTRLTFPIFAGAETVFTAKAAKGMIGQRPTMRLDSIGVGTAKVVDARIADRGHTLFLTVEVRTQ